MKRILGNLDARARASTSPRDLESNLTPPTVRRAPSSHAGRRAIHSKEKVPLTTPVGENQIHHAGDGVSLATKLTHSTTGDPSPTSRSLGARPTTVGGVTSRREDRSTVASISPALGHDAGLCSSRTNVVGEPSPCRRRGALPTAPAHGAFVASGTTARGFIEAAGVAVATGTAATVGSRGSERLKVEEKKSEHSISPRAAKKVLPHFLAIGNSGNQALLVKEGPEIVQRQVIFLRSD